MTIRRVYIAGAWTDLTRLAEEANELQARGYTVVSTWLTHERDTTGSSSYIQSGTKTPEVELQYEMNAKRDLAEVMMADLFILDTATDNNRGGREVEFGIALSKGIPTIVVGPFRNVFHRLATYHFGSWDDLFYHQDRRGNLL